MSKKASVEGRTLPYELLSKFMLSTIAVQHRAVAEEHFGALHLIHFEGKVERCDAIFAGALGVDLARPSPHQKVDDIGGPRGDRLVNRGPVEAAVTGPGHTDSSTVPVDQLDDPKVSRGAGTLERGPAVDRVGGIDIAPL